ncbi:BRO family protein [Thalassospira xiamenensis]|jgi:prophage antirepressor-like protein|uniref:BRO family protein n=1 Tax=Thalassospira xiamenensis TaxID=220697 RepID=UPI001FFE5779|nr:Bro-N domain-containing protein [Thalassospira xiamenensis]MCK2169092.1 Bro-N domain-containing protein [Thalassospira xiamenensis]
MSEIIPFSFEGIEIRTVHKNGDPWFVAMDVCKALGLSNPHKGIESLDDDEKDEVTLSDSIGRQQEMNIINESGLYILILRSRNAVKPGTLQHRFRKWVTSEVLPVIRKTGRYEAEISAITAEGMTLAEFREKQEELRQIELDLLRRWHQFSNEILDRDNRFNKLLLAATKVLIENTNLSDQEISELVDAWPNDDRCPPEWVAWRRRKVTGNNSVH